MSHVIIGDLIHPDTLNLWLEDSGLAGVTDIVLFRKAEDWLAIVPGYVKVPVLRRLRLVSDGWRHFPMEDWRPESIAPRNEIEGVKVQIGALSDISTWLVQAALDAEPRIRDRLQYLARCLDFISFFPRYAFLRETSVQLEFAWKAGKEWKRSCQLQELLVLAHRSFSEELLTVHERPSARQLLGEIDAVLRAISETTLEIRTPAQIQQRWVDQGLPLFDDVTTRFVDGPVARTFSLAANWAPQNKIILVPKILRTPE